jgi:hypothetical protein
MLNVIYAECSKQTHYAECRYAECHYAEYRYAECRHAEYRYAECPSAMLSAFYKFIRLKCKLMTVRNTLAYYILVLNTFLYI